MKRRIRENSIDYFTFDEPKFGPPMKKRDRIDRLNFSQELTPSNQKDPKKGFFIKKLAELLSSYLNLQREVDETFKDISEELSAWDATILKTSFITDLKKQLRGEFYKMKIQEAKKRRKNVGKMKKW